MILQSRLAACVSQLPENISSYWWKGKIHSAREHLLIIKTTRSARKTLFQLIESNHPYEVPEILSFAITSGNKSYLDWIESEVNLS